MWVAAFMNWTINGIRLKMLLNKYVSTHSTHSFLLGWLLFFFFITVPRKETRTGPTMTHSSTNNLRIARLHMSVGHSPLKKFTTDYMCRGCWTRKHIDNGIFVLWSLCGILKPTLRLGILP